MAGGMFEAQLRTAYRGAFDCILRELNPQRHAREARHREVARRTMTRDLKKAAADERHELDCDRELWSELG